MTQHRKEATLHHVLNFPRISKYETSKIRRNDCHANASNFTMLYSLNLSQLLEKKPPTLKTDITRPLHCDDIQFDNTYL